MKKIAKTQKYIGTTMSVAKAKQISKTSAGGVKANLKKAAAGGGRSK